MSKADNDLTSRFNVPSPADEIAEVSLLLPRWQMDALESAAETQGLTAGQLLRRVIAQFAAGVMPMGQGYFLG